MKVFEAVLNMVPRRRQANDGELQGEDQISNQHSPEQETVSEHRW
jgi:hypothetical protein